MHTASDEKANLNFDDEKALLLTFLSLQDGTEVVSVDRLVCSLAIRYIECLIAA